MKCICSNWDDESPCPQHTPKLVQPSMVEHQCIVVRVYRRRSNKKWFYTVTTDAVQVDVSSDQEKKPKIVIGQ